jgi:hypothetical protein
MTIHQLLKQNAAAADHFVPGAAAAAVADYAVVAM